MTAALLALVALMWAIRASRVRGLWSHPLRNGEGWFLAQPVAAGFYRGEGAALLRRYRLCLFLPLVVDAPLALWLGISGRYLLLLCEQWIALIVTVVAYNLILAHFSARATARAGGAGETPVTTVHLSMEPRRLRDHTNRWAELAIAACVVVSLAVLARGRMQALASGDRHLRHTVAGGMVLSVWLLYLQLGLLLLKLVFVRWRIPLPVRRTEDFRRWRSAWLSYHLKLFDALRLTFVLVLPTAMTKLVFEHPVPRAAWAGMAAFWVPSLLVLFFYLIREQRRLAAVEREIKPVELVKEFPPSPVAEGRFLAGGMLYFNRANPRVLVRSAQGLALNLGHASTYAWAGYFFGLALIMTWMAR